MRNQVWSWAGKMPALNSATRWIPLRALRESVAVRLVASQGSLEAKIAAAVSEQNSLVESDSVSSRGYRWRLLT